jgi:hypothetical protein
MSLEVEIIKSLEHKPFDLLFVDKARDYQAGLVSFLLNHSMNVQNIAEVESDLYHHSLKDKEGICFEVKDADSQYLFTGNMPNPKNSLVIVNESIRFGRKFDEICQAVQSLTGRDVQSGEPPTYAFFRRKEYDWLSEAKPIEFGDAFVKLDDTPLEVKFRQFYALQDKDRNRLPRLEQH